MWFQSGEFSLNVRKWCGVTKVSIHDSFNCSHFFSTQDRSNRVSQCVLFLNNENITYYYWINICIFKKSAFVIVNAVGCLSTANIKARSAWLFDHCYDFSLCKSVHLQMRWIYKYFLKGTPQSLSCNRAINVNAYLIFLW